jgi:hypothetical protein
VDVPTRELTSDYHPSIRVIMPTPDGIRSVHIKDLIPFATTRDNELDRLPRAAPVAGANPVPSRPEGGP